MLNSKTWANGRGATSPENVYNFSSQQLQIINSFKGLAINKRVVVASDINKGDRIEHICYSLGVDVYSLIEFIKYLLAQKVDILKDLNTAENVSEYILSNQELVDQAKSIALMYEARGHKVYFSKTTLEGEFKARQNRKNALQEVKNILDQIKWAREESKNNLKYDPQKKVGYRIKWDDAMQDLRFYRAPWFTYFDLDMVCFLYETCLNLENYSSFEKPMGMKKTEQTVTETESLTSTKPYHILLSFLEEDPEVERFETYQNFASLEKPKIAFRKFSTRHPSFMQMLDFINNNNVVTINFFCEDFDKEGLETIIFALDSMIKKGELRRRPKLGFEYLYYTNIKDKRRIAFKDILNIVQKYPDFEYVDPRLNFKKS